MIEEYDTFITNYVIKIYDKIVNNQKININLLLNEDKLIQRNILEKYIYSIYGDDIVCWDDVKTNILFNMINESKPNIVVDFPNNMVLDLNYSKTTRIEILNKLKKYI